MQTPKPFEIIYTEQRYGLEKGKRYANPRYFSTPRAKATKVYLDGDWPKVEEAYKAAGVPVVHLGKGEAAPAATGAEAGKPALHVGKKDDGKFYILNADESIHSGPFDKKLEANMALKKELGA